MLINETKIRVRYAETDQMGYVYYGRYAEYYEIGRTEMIRELGFSYKHFEETGIMLPVQEMKIKYYRPGKYDDLILIKTSLLSLPTAKITFHYELFNEDGEKLNEGEVSLVFTDAATRRPMRPPQSLIKALEAFFK